MNKSTNNLILAFFCIALLLKDGFINSFPLVYPDTGTYIRSGFELINPIDRPIFYGIFINIFSFHLSLWLVIGFQALIAYYLIYEFIKIYLDNKYFKYVLTTVILVLTLCTSLSFYVCILLPDIFTAYLLLAGFILLRKDELSKIKLSILGLLIFICIIVHYSNLYIFSIFYLLILIFSLLYKGHNKIIVPFKRCKFIGLIFLFSIIFIPTYNYISNKKFTISESGHIFMMNKLNELGLLEPFLNEKCIFMNYNLCINKDSLPWDLIWDAKSPITNNGDWNKSKFDNQKIIFDLLTDYKYLFKFIFKNLIGSFKQFFIFNSGDTMGGEQCKPALLEIDKYFDDEKKEFISSIQFKNQLNFEFINLIQYHLIYISLLICILTLLYFDFSIKHKLVVDILLLISYLFTNGFICSTFSIVLNRYQSRVIWLIPLFAIVICIKFILSKKYLHLLKRMAL